MQVPGHTNTSRNERERCCLVTRSVSHRRQTPRFFNRQSLQNVHDTIQRTVPLIYFSTFSFAPLGNASMNSVKQTKAQGVISDGGGVFMDPHFETLTKTVDHRGTSGILVSIGTYRF